MSRFQPAKVRRVVEVVRIRGRRFLDSYWEARCNAGHGRGRKKEWAERHPTHNGAHMAKAAHNRQFHAS